MKKEKRIPARVLASNAAEFKLGALLAVDIGNSTKVLLGGSPGLVGCLRLERTIQSLCNTVHEQAGSVMSYTGDGFIAFFDKSLYLEDLNAAEQAFNAAVSVCEDVERLGARNLTARAALHWGSAYVPSSGPLSDQIIGGEVVCTTRLCDWLGRVIELAQPPPKRKRLMAATDGFVKIVATSERKRRQWMYWGVPDFKGLTTAPGVYLFTG